MHSHPNQANILTVDVEDYFQVSAFENVIARSHWDSLEHRVEKNTHRILDLFDKHNAKATFFVLGWVAERYPSVVQRIVNEGHELASHGYGHQRLTKLNQKEAQQDIEKSKLILEDISSAEVIGYRAPSFSINSSNIWVYQIIKELGFQYSSSTYPIKHDLYGEPNWPRQAYKTNEDILEIPASTLQITKRNFPIAGGGYYRLLPYWLTKHAISRYVKAESAPYMFYFHPWEIDPGQPKFSQASLKSKLRHYTNLHCMERKIEKLLASYQWQTVKAHYASELVSTKSFVGCNCD